MFQLIPIKFITYFCFTHDFWYLLFLWFYFIFFFSNKIEWNFHGVYISPSRCWLVRGSLNKFIDFFCMDTWNSSTLRSNLLRLQCTCCTVPTTSGRPHGGPLVWACQWPSSQPLLSPHLSHNDSLWALGITKSHKEQGLDYREAEELCWCPSLSNSLWQGWSCGLVYCPGGNATNPIWRVLASSLGISYWTPLKPRHSNPNPNLLANQLWCIDFLTPPTPLTIPHRLPAFLESLLCHSKTDARFKPDVRKAVWSIP